ncbi:MAG: 4Fe-4S binding protein [Candidatus Ratteibacteria bacterium]|nr:4Fe-4S binding protein [Candidatus Ratteibacteria bacterium]
MEKRRLVLTFPASLVGEPITYKLVKDYDIVLNILKAQVTPEEEGKLVVDLQGTESNLKNAITYLKNLGVTVQPLKKDVRMNKDKCTHCTVCVTVCPTKALTVDRKTMNVQFIPEKCIACELCIPACPYNAMEILI